MQKAILPMLLVMPVPFIFFQICGMINFDFSVDMPNVEKLSMMVVG